MAGSIALLSDVPRWAECLFTPPSGCDIDHSVTEAGQRGDGDRGACGAVVVVASVRLAGDCWNLTPKPQA